MLRCFQQHQVVVVSSAGRGADDEDLEGATRLTNQMDNGNNMPQSSWVSPPPYEEVEKIGVSTALSI